MAVLQLSDESRAMREAAKGWSLGKIPRDDYRMIRRATLVSMMGIDPDLDETVAGSLDDQVDVTETVDHTPVAPRGAGSNKLLLIAAAAVVLVGGLLALFLLV